MYGFNINCFSLGLYHVRRKFLRGMLIFVMMKKIVSIILVGLVCLSADLPSSAIKKLDKAIQTLWENQIVDKVEVDISKHQFQNSYLKLSKLMVSNKLVGYLMISRAKSRVDFFDYMVVYKPDLSILAITVLAYREDYGGEIASKRWLNQFTGKTNPDNMKFGDDIQSISGATLSARSLTQDVQEITKNIQILKTKGVL